MKRFIASLALAILLVASSAWADRAQYVPNLIVAEDSLTQGRDQYTYVVDAAGVYTSLVNTSDPNAAVTAATVHGGTVWLRHTGVADNTDYVVAASDIIPADVVVKIDKGARISVASGQVLTFNTCPEAGRYNIFTGDGTVVFAEHACDNYHPEWFDDADSITDGIQELANALPNGGTILLAGRVYYLDMADDYEPAAAVNIIYDDINLVGSTQNSSQILINYADDYDDTTDADIVRVTTSNRNDIKNILFAASEAMDGGAAINYYGYVAGGNHGGLATVRDCYIFGNDFIFIGINLLDVNYMIVENNYIGSTLDDGINIIGSDYEDYAFSTINDNVIEYCDNAGISINENAIVFARRNWVYANEYGFYIIDTGTFVGDVVYSQKIMENDIDGSKSYGIYMNGLTSSQINDNWFSTNCASRNASCRVVRAANCNNIQFNGNFMNGTVPATLIPPAAATYNHGLYLEGNNVGWTISGNHLIGCDSAIYFNAVTNETYNITGNSILSSVYGVHLWDGGVNVNIGNNLFSANTTAAILVGEDSASINMVGNLFNTNGIAIDLTTTTATDDDRGFIDGNLFDNNTIDIRPGSGSWMVGANRTDNLTESGTGVNLTTWGTTYIDASAGIRTLTLPNPTYPGQVKTIIMTNAAHVANLSILNHQDGNPEAVLFDAVGETGVFMWTGTEWVTTFATCTFP